MGDCATFGSAYLKSRARAVDRAVDDLSRSQGSVPADHTVHYVRPHFLLDLSSRNLDTQSEKK